MIIRKVVQGYHNIYTSPPEYTINSAQGHRLWRSFSLASQKFSKQTLPLVRDVNSPASQQSPPNNVHYSSQRSIVFFTKLIITRARIP